MTDRRDKENGLPSEGQKRSYIGANLRFWGRNIIEELGMSLGAACFLLLLRWFGRSQVAAPEIFLSFPYLLLTGGGFLILMMVMAGFQTYFPVLISMNVTRKTAVTGLWLSQAVVALFLTAVMGLIWKLTPGEEAQASLTLLPAFAGILLGIIGVSTILGTVWLRWGRIGTIIIVLFCLLGGIGGGMAYAMCVDDSVLNMQQVSSGVSDGIRYTLLLAGALLYVASGVFARILTRKAEVRV